jgi:hypothetical protein
VIDEDQASTYGMLVQSVIAELSDVLSSNPFLLNPQKSVAVLTFMACLAGGILITILYLMGLDKTDLIHKNYVQRESDSAARKHLEYDLKHGGKGDLGESYQKYSEEFQSDKVTQASVMSSIYRTSNKIGRMKKIGKISQRGTTRKQARIDILDLNPDEEDKALTEAKAQFFRSTAASVKYADSDDASSTDDDNSSDIVETDDQNTIAAVVTEFLHKLFPGRSIFFSAENNVVGTVYTYHQYFCMFAGSELTKSRAIRFINVVAMVLTAIFTDTVFFGLYFPAVSQCIGHDDQVRGRHLERSQRNLYVTEYVISQCIHVQTTCLSDPSKVQKGASQCQWDMDTTMCSEQDPPDDHAFTILVALLTAILSTPLLVAVTFVLDTYASTWPGSRGVEDDVSKIEEDLDDDKTCEKSDEIAEPDTAAVLRNSTRKSEFGDVIKRAVLRGGTAGKDTAAEIAQLAYAGE